MIDSNYGNSGFSEFIERYKPLIKTVVYILAVVAACVFYTFEDIKNLKASIFRTKKDLPLPASL